MSRTVNKLMQSWGLNSIRATGIADDWFKALRAAAGPEALHRQAKTPFGLSSPRDMGKLVAGAFTDGFALRGEWR
jgi:hypothetical protein